MIGSFGPYRKLYRGLHNFKESMRNKQFYIVKILESLANRKQKNRL